MIFADTVRSKILLPGFCSTEKSFFCKWQTRTCMKRMTVYSECSESEGKRCQAHFLLQVFGEGYEVNHWELDDEVKLFSRSLVSDSLPPRRLQHARFPCPTPTPGVYSNSCPLSRWCHPTIIPCRSLLLLPSVFPSIRIFSNESALRIRWLKYWSFSFNISPSSAYSELISFRMDWLDLLAVQGTLKSSPTQFKSISPWVLSFLYSPSLTSIHDYWKNHSFD